MIYELKKYTPTAGNATALRQRFEAHTMPIFARLGIRVLQCWDLPDEPDVLAYLVVFDNEASRKAAWAAFGLDAEWRAAKAASETDGPLLASQSTTTLLPTAFSPNGVV